MSSSLQEINNVDRIRDKLNFLKAAKKANATQPKHLIKSGINQPVLCPKTKVQPLFSWADSAPRIGGGLINLGNSCFMNSSLQCIIYTAPFFNYCKQREHSRTCKSRSGFCSFCELEKLVLKASKCPTKQAFRPNTIFTNLKRLSSTLRPGRQEDAHEFIRVLLDSLHNVCCAPFKPQIKKDAKMVKHPIKELQYTSAVHRMWGGFLRSQVHCQACGKDSNTDDPMLGVSLATQSNLIRAFKKYTAKEQLTGTEKYFCEHCKKKQNAYKRMQILKPPPVLAVHLKRFEFSKSGNRIKKSEHVTFERELDIAPFVVDAKSAVKYELFGVLVHSGKSAYGGHYYSYVRAPGNESKRWFLMNDSSVSPADFGRVKQQQAYILMYQMTPATLEKHFKSTKESATPLKKPVKAKPHPVKQIPVVSKYDDSSYAPVPTELTYSSKVQRREEVTYAPKSQRHDELTYAGRGAQKSQRHDELTYAGRGVRHDDSSTYVPALQRQRSDERSDERKAPPSKADVLASSYLNLTNKRKKTIDDYKYDVSNRGDLSDRSSSGRLRSAGEIVSGRSDYIRGVSFSKGSNSRGYRNSPDLNVNIERTRYEVSKPPTYRPNEKFDTNSILNRWNMDDSPRTRKSKHISPQIKLDPDPMPPYKSFVSTSESSSYKSSFKKEENPYKPSFKKEENPYKPTYLKESYDSPYKSTYVKESKPFKTEDIEAPVISSRRTRGSEPPTPLTYYSSRVHKTTDPAPSIASSFSENPALDWADLIKESQPPNRGPKLDGSDGISNFRNRGASSYARPHGISTMRRNYSRDTYRQYRTIRT